ncbi:MAG: TRAP transporter substrate-binding protein [Xylophilus ampelinus]
MPSITRRAAVALASSFALLAAAPAIAQVKERTIKFAYLNQGGHPQDLGARRFAELVSKASGGKMQVKVFPGGVLGGDLQNVSALQGGTLEMTNLNAGILSSHVRQIGVFDVPFLFTSPAQADAITDGPLGRKLLDMLSEKGMVGLGYFDLGFRNLTNSRRPVARAEDIAGLKIRVIQSPIYIDLFNALGANATPMPFPEVYGALEQKAIDGQENPYSTIKASRFNEVQKYLTVTRHIYNPMALIFSKKVWDTYSADEKKIVADAAAAAISYQRQVSRQQSDEALAELRKSGMQVTELPPAEIEKMRAKAKPAIDKLAEKVGPETIQEAYAELAKLNR